jgi:tRNA(Ile)-lysidine synthetase-like protein
MQFIDYLKSNPRIWFSATNKDDKYITCNYELYLNKLYNMRFNYNGDTIHNIIYNNLDSSNNNLAASNNISASSNNTLDASNNNLDSSNNNLNASNNNLNASNNISASSNNTLSVNMINLIEYIITLDQLPYYISRYHNYDKQYIEMYHKQSLAMVCHLCFNMDYNKINNLSMSLCPNTVILNILFSKDIDVFYKVFLLLPLRHSKNDKLLYICTQLSKLILSQHSNDNIARRFYKATVLQFEKSLNTYVTTHYNSSNILLNKHKVSFYNILDTENSNTKLWTFKEYNNFIDNINNKYKLQRMIKYNYLYNKFTGMVNYMKSCNITKVLLSISGGVDSMSLYILLKLNNIEVHTLFINYGNRDESILELEFIKSFISKFKASNETFNYKTITSIKRNNKNTRDIYEDVTRQIRFDMYSKLCDKLDVNYVALGHNKDDCLENILTNISKKQKYNNLNGMSVISKEDNVNIIRPLLDIYKAEIYTFANSLNIPYLKDSTPKWSTRGRLRDILIPQIKTFDHKLLDGLFTVADYTYKANKYLEKYAMTYLIYMINNIEFNNKKHTDNKLHISSLDIKLLSCEHDDMYSILECILSYISHTLNICYVSKKSIYNIHTILIQLASNSDASNSIASNSVASNLVASNSIASNKQYSINQYLKLKIENLSSNVITNKSITNKVIKLYYTN